MKNMQNSDLLRFLSVTRLLSMKNMQNSDLLRFLSVTRLLSMKNMQNSDLLRFFSVTDDVGWVLETPPCIGVALKVHNRDSQKNQIPSSDI